MSTLDPREASQKEPPRHPSNETCSRCGSTPGEELVFQGSCIACQEPTSLQTTIVNILEAKPEWSITLNSLDSRTMRVTMRAKSHTMSRAISWAALDQDQHEIALRTELEFMEKQLEEAEPPEQGID